MPDPGTLRLCSLLLTAAFSVVFLTLWAGRRREWYLLHWALSAALYGVVLILFDRLEPIFSPLTGGGLHLALAFSNTLLLSGTRLFDRLPAFTPSMALPPLLCLLGFALPLWLWGQAGVGAARAGGAAGLLVSVSSVAVGIWLGQQGPRGRRIAAVAEMAYVPCYLASILIIFWQVGDDHPLVLLGPLSDQALLTVLYLGLLSMPGEHAQSVLREAALRDPLTGAWNRAGLQAQRAEMGLRGGAVILVDIDHFKTINDRHGHAAGDAVLCAFAARMMALALDQGGQLVRLGGDEFMVLMPSADLAAAQRLARRMQAAPAAAEGVLPYAFSLGLAVRPPLDAARGTEWLVEAMAEADAALYRAKGQGRSRLGPTDIQLMRG